MGHRRTRARAVRILGRAILESLEERLVFGVYPPVGTGYCPDCNTNTMLSGGAGPAGDGSDVSVIPPGAMAGATPGQNMFTAAPVRYFDGTARIEATDISDTIFGGTLGISRSYSNKMPAGYWQTNRTSTNTTGN